MQSTLANLPLSPKVPEFDRGGLKPAKATLPTKDEFEHGDAIWEVLVKEHDSVKAMAYQMGPIDRSLLRRRIQDGSLTIKELFKADPKALAAFGDFLKEHYGETKKSKQEIARERLPELLATFLDAFSGGGK